MSENNDHRYMMMEDYTSLWNAEKTVYSLGNDFTLPAPVKAMSLVAFLLTFLVMIVPLVLVFGIKIWTIAIPAIAGIICASFISKPIFSKRSAGKAIPALLGFVFSPKIAYNMETQNKPEKKEEDFHGSVYFPNN